VTPAAATPADPAVASPAGAEGTGGAAATFAYQPALDGLRGLAVAAVVAFHLDEQRLTGGFLGVDAFFVLSGFLITTLLVLEWRRHAAAGRSGPGINLGGFWGRRARRLLPALLLVLLAVAVFAAIDVPTDELGRLRGDGIAGLFYAANWRFVASGQSYFDLFTSPSPFRHLWSLAIEEQFYLVWPLVTLGCLTLARGRLRLLATVAAVGAAVSVVLMAVLYQSGDPSRSYYGTDTHAHPILVGVLLALVLVGRPEASARVRRLFDAVGAVALLAMLATFAFAHDTSPRLYRGGSLGFALLVAIVIATVMRAPRGALGRAFALRPLVALGVISYGVYLWHWPIIVYATEERTGLSGVPLQVLQVALTLVVSIASYLLVERPIRRGFRTRRAWAWAPAGLALGLVAVLASTAGATEAPAYLRGGGSAAPTSSTTLAPPRPGNPSHVVLVGDSLALSLGPGLDAAFRADGIRFEADAVPGCSVLRGVTLQENGQPYQWSRACNRAITPALKKVVATDPKPDLVLWLSTWDAVDRTLHGHHVSVGTKRGDAALAAEIRHAAKLLTAHGARLVILSVADPVPGSKSPLPGLDQESRVREIKALYRRAAPTPDGRVRVVDLDPLVCPHGRCSQIVDGVELRPDGSHFGEDGARVIGKQLASVLLACWHDPTTCH
jgi:peptidoglycan/LPS O-acetylase OafA/YrhL